MKLFTKFLVRIDISCSCHRIDILDIIVIHYHTGQVEGFRKSPNFRLRSIRIKLFGKKYFFHKLPFIKFYPI